MGLQQKSSCGLPLSRPTFRLCFWSRRCMNHPAIRGPGHGEASLFLSLLSQRKGLRLKETTLLLRMTSPVCLCKLIGNESPLFSKENKRIMECTTTIWLFCRKQFVKYQGNMNKWKDYERRWCYPVLIPLCILFQKYSFLRIIICGVSISLAFIIVV